MTTSNAGALLSRQADRRFKTRFARCFTDRRDPRYLDHSVEMLVGQRVFGLALVYEDLNDHDELGQDPAFAALAGRLTPVLRRPAWLPPARARSIGAVEAIARIGLGADAESNHEAVKSVKKSGHRELPITTGVENQRIYVGLNSQGFDPQQHDLVIAGRDLPMDRAFEPDRRTSDEHGAAAGRQPVDARKALASADRELSGRDLLLST
jgi:hypothetical protein